VLPTFLSALILLLAGCFGFVLLRGAPYLPTLDKQVKAALDLIDLDPGDTLLELGCGDGKVMIAAAQRGLHVTGYELNPIMAFIAWVRLRPYKNAHVVWGDFWSKPWPKADGIFVFLLDTYMEKLDTKIVQSKPKHVKNSKGIKLVSFAFQIPDKMPIAERQGVYLYTYH
jgi:16S rRNA A1518/A1519 N6-dimethyltransferase RsmA/KsgA/DIM1 with predicted DNA glycosylase/AP lyase activity